MKPKREIFRWSELLRHRTRSSGGERKSRLVGENDDFSLRDFAVMLTRYPQALLSISILLLVLAGQSAHAAGTSAKSGADLRWDLTYQSALRDHPIGPTEFMQFWISRYPDRAVPKKIAEYSGEPIEASLLIEMPGGDAGDPLAQWFIKTHSGAQSCTFYKSRSDPCTQLDPNRVAQMVRIVTNFKSGQFKDSNQNKLNNSGSPEVLINYYGFVSVYIDGVVMQRPISVLEIDGAPAADDSVNPEIGRLGRAISMATLSPEEFQKRELEQRQLAIQHALPEAAKRGDIPRMRSLLDQGADPGKDNSLALAVGATQIGAIELLLQRGAKIDVGESSALKAAVRANNASMVEYLFAKGAQVDPSVDAWGRRNFYETALGTAVVEKNIPMAQLLLRHGADVNATQSIPMIAVAARSGDLPMLDLLLSKGARPDSLPFGGNTPALMEIVNRGATHDADSSSRSTTVDPLSPELEALVITKLVAGGADVNRIDANCNTAYQAARDKNSDRLTGLLSSLGADPELALQCRERLAQGKQGSEQGTEITARRAVMNSTKKMLTEGNYQGLEDLYDKILNSKELTPAGIWKLSLFYNQLKAFPERRKDAAYWIAMETRIVEWETAFPNSVPAHLFHAYALWNHGVSCSGDCPVATMKDDDRLKMIAAAKAAIVQLQTVQGRAKNDPEWYRAWLTFLAYTGVSMPELERAAREAIAAHPNYSETYFSAAYYLTPAWGGAPTAVDWVASGANQAGVDKRVMYARVYWYLDQVEFKGELFKHSDAKWRDMKDSFEELVHKYPDPWNLNAYAYYACMANDYPTMDRLLQQLGTQLVFLSWGADGANNFEQCRRHRHPAIAKQIPSSYNDAITYAIYMRQIAHYDESLKAIDKARVTGDAYNHPAMMTMYHLGWTLSEMGRYRDAIDAFNSGLLAQPDYFGAIWRRGLAWEALGNKKEAAADFKKTWTIVNANHIKFDREPALAYALSEKLRQYHIANKLIPLQ